MNTRVGKISNTRVMKQNRRRMWFAPDITVGLAEEALLNSLPDPAAFSEFLHFFLSKISLSFLVFPYERSFCKNI